MDLAAARPERANALLELVEPMRDGRVASLGFVETLIESLPDEAMKQLQGLGYLVEDPPPSPAEAADRRD